MATDDERREVAERLRRAWANVPDKNSVRHHMRVLYEIYAAVGLNDDGVDAIDLFDRLADLIEPDEPKVKCVAEVKVDGERLEKLARDAAAELTGIDRDALLALAEELEEDACWEVQTPGDTSGAWRLKDTCDRIRKALGVES